MVYDDDKTTQDNQIRGKALYFSTSQVADILTIPDSKVRYYTNVFDDILHIEVSNKQRRYTQADIDKMRFLVELKNEGMTIKQIQEYCQQVDFRDSNDIQIKENNPLSIQVIAKSLLEQQSLLINEMKHDIVNIVVGEINKSLDYQNEQFNQMKNNLNGDLAITVEETINKQLNNSSENIQNQIKTGFDKVNDSIKERDITLVENLRESLKDEKIKALELEIEELKRQQSQPKSFLSKLFHKSK